MNWVLGKYAGGVFSNLDGSVRSLNPNAGTPPTTYHWETRPAGTAGAFELCTVDGGAIAYNPLGSEVQVYGFKASVPNAAGVSAMTVDPL
jgi:hypothetical protein